jgi:hypothetical protein
MMIRACVVCIRYLLPVLLLKGGGQRDFDRSGSQVFFEDPRHHTSPTQY